VLASPAASDLLLLEEFFAPAEVTRLWTYALDHQADFLASEVVGDAAARRDEEFRRSRVLFDVAEIYPLVTERVLHVLPHVTERLSLAPFPVREIELQVTASNDSEWFKPHRDSDGGSGGPVGDRELTFVYYCHREPHGFTGGALRMYGAFADVAQEGNHATVPGNSTLITPAQNSVVFFPSHYLHEVMPTYCPSGRFEDSRLTYNGWLHR
jgi:SM-20-related protein